MTKLVYHIVMWAPMLADRPSGTSHSRHGVQVDRQKMEALALKSAGREIREAHSVVGASGGGPKCAGSYGNSKEKTKGVGTAGDGLAGKDNGAGISNWRVGGVISRGLGWTVEPWTHNHATGVPRRPRRAHSEAPTWSAARQSQSTGRRPPGESGRLPPGRDWEPVGGHQQG